MATQAAIATLSNILKDLYLPPVQEQLNNEVLFFSRIASSDKEIVGNQAVVPLHKGRTGGVGSRGETDALPSAGAQGYAKAVFDIKQHYGRVRITGLAMAKTAKDAGAFLRGLQAELDFIRSDLKIDQARQSYMDGTGRIQQCGTTTAASVVVLSSSEALRKGWLYIGMNVDIGTLADPVVVASNREITDFNLATPSITISGATVTTSSSHFVFRSGNAAASSVSNEMDGLDKLVSTSANTVGNIDAGGAGNSYWDNLRDATGGALSLAGLNKGFNTVRAAGGSPSVLLMSLGLQRALFQLLQPQVRYNEPQTLKGGFKALDYFGQPAIADKDAWFGRIYILDESKFRHFADGDWHFLDQDGHAIKWVTGYDAWEAVLARYSNFGIVRRNQQLVMTGFTDDPLGI